VPFDTVTLLDVSAGAGTGAGTSTGTGTGAGAGTILLLFYISFTCCSNKSVTSISFLANKSTSFRTLFFNFSISFNFLPAFFFTHIY
jgi:hypothetical protein